MSKALPKLIQITNRCSHSPLWWNTTGLCEVKSRIYAVNRWKCYPDYFPDPLALRELVKVRGRAWITQIHQKYGMSQSVANADESVRFTATFKFLTNTWVSAGFVVYGHWTRCSGWRWRSPNEGLDLDLFHAVVWILKICITAHEYNCFMS